VSTAPWNNPSGWTDKRKWVEKYLPLAKKKLILTHNKNMILGDFLIDDRLKNGADQFSGKFIHFGQTPFDNWGKILEFFNREI
jgi:5'(3')-deoxyribonucleotidase